MRKPASVLPFIICTLLTFGSCGDDDGGGTNRAGGGGGGGGGDSVDTEFEEDGGATLTTELDLGGPFAEDPSASGQLGPMTVAISSARASIETPSVFIDLTNPGGATLTGVTLTAQLQDGGGTPPATDQALVLSAESAEGDCSVSGATPQSATVSCAFGDVAAGATVGVDLLITGLPRLSMALGLQAGGG
jgi:hypothetical protein